MSVQRVRALAEAVASARVRLHAWFDVHVRPIAQRLVPPRAVVLALLFVTSLCVWVPFEPAMPACMLDESWALGLNQAVAQGLTFGQDLIFTFGPYSFVFSKMYHPATDALMLVSSAYLAVTYWVALVYLTRDSKRFLPWALLAMLAGVMYARDALLLSYPLFVGLVCCRRSEHGLPRNFTWGAALLFSSFGLLPLVKGSMLALCGLVVPISFALFAYERRWRLAACVVISPLVSLAAFWMLVGQPVAALPQHFRALMPIISGYAGAMAFSNDGKQVLFFVASATLLLAASLVDKRAPKWPRLCVFAIYGAFCFVALKAGFVRHDSHALICGVAVLLAAVVFVGTAQSRLTPFVLVAALATWLYIDRAHMHSSATSVGARVVATYSSAWTGLSRRITEPSLEQQYEGVLALVRNGSGIPQLEGSTDAYSFQQTRLIASGNRWNPRPILQSYSVYTDYLDASNREHLLGSSAPDNVIFRVEPIDLRLPSLEDGASWPILLTRYQPVSFIQETLLLRRRVAAETMEMTTVESSMHRLGRAVRVPDVDGFVFVNIDLQPSLLGRIVGLLYKPTTLYIKVTLATGQSRVYRYIAAMGRMGILISPLVESTLDFASMYGGIDYLDWKRVRSFVIGTEGSKRTWTREFRVTFKTMKMKPIVDPRRFYTLDEVVPDVPELAATNCEGVLDVANGMSPVPGAFSAKGLLRIEGWLARSTKPAAIPDSVFAVLTDAQGRNTLFATRREKRPDVGRYFAQPALDAAGYVAYLDIATLEGTYALGLAVRDGDRIERCSNWSYTVDIKPVLAPTIEGR